jgi:hypothetical protein
MSFQYACHSSIGDPVILTCRLELLFRSVFAHPKLSNKGFVASTMSLISLIDELALSPETAAMYCMICLAASVLPAPDSPLYDD